MLTRSLLLLYSVAFFVACDSAALRVEDVSELDVEAVPSPFIPADSESIELQLIAAELPLELREEIPDQTPRLVEQSVGPFTVRSQSFPNAFTLKVQLELLGGATPGESVELSFLILNSYGYFRLNGTVEFY